MFIREAIREFHDAIAMPAMAPIVFEQPADSDAATRYAERTNARLNAFEREVVAFGVAARGLAVKLEKPALSADEEDLAELRDFIAHIERTAEGMAKVDARTEKDMLRNAKRQERRDAALAQAYRRTAIRLAELNAQTIETLLALALEMRALKSSLTPSERSPTFDNPEDLGRYLDAAMRA